MALLRGGKSKLRNHQQVDQAAEEADRQGCSGMEPWPQEAGTLIQEVLGELLPGEGVCGGQGAQK